MSVYVSTGAFQTRKIQEILDLAYRYNIKNLELSPGLKYDADTIEIINSVKKDFNFLVHNYFPTPKKGFALNLASDDENIEMQSRKMCISAVDICADLNIPYYSVHSGFCFNAGGKDLGNKSQTELRRIPLDEAKKRFFGNIKALCDYGLSRNVGILVENNVVADFANGDKGLLLGVNSEDIMEILSSVSCKNLGFLMDLAHAKVSGSNYGFDVEDFIHATRQFVKEVHVSENNGLLDQNKKISKNCDVFNWLSYYKDVNITIEVYDLSIDEIYEQIELVNEAIS